MDTTVTHASWPEAGRFVRVLAKVSLPEDSRVPLSCQKSNKAFANLVRLTFPIIQSLIVIVPSPPCLEFCGPHSSLEPVLGNRLRSELLSIA